MTAIWCIAVILAAVISFRSFLPKEIDSHHVSEHPHLRDAELKESSLTVKQEGFEILKRQAEKACMEHTDFESWSSCAKLYAENQGSI